MEQEMTSSSVRKTVEIPKDFDIIESVFERSGLYSIKSASTSKSYYEIFCLSSVCI